MIELTPLARPYAKALFEASFPVLRRLLRPLCSALGRKNKRRYLKRHRSSESGE